MTDEAREVIGKARRSFGFSMSILILGFMAIVLALVYRATRDEESAAARFSLPEISIPADAEVISIVPVGNVIAVTFDRSGKIMMRIVDTASGEIMKEVPVVTE